MKILLIEDNYIWQIKIKELLLAIDGKYQIDICTNIESSRQYLESRIPDLLISDVCLEDELIFDLFENTDYTHIPCIFMTVSEDESFYSMSKISLNALYLIKPLQQLTLKSAIDNVLSNHIRKIGKSPRGISVKGIHNEKIILTLNDIYIVESEWNYCILKTRRNKYVIKASLKKIQDDLGSDIIQIHKKYLVNKKFITKINLSKMEVITDIEILPVGRKYRPNLEEYLTDQRIL